MSIIVARGNLLDSQAEALVNTINCVGVMGAGLALDFKNRFPHHFQAYKLACKLHQVVPGKIFVSQEDSGIYCLGFPTKQHWRDPSKLEWIVSGLHDLVEVVQQLEIKSLAITKLGCGLGGLSWDDVKPLIVASCEEQIPDATVYLYG